MKAITTPTFWIALSLFSAVLLQTNSFAFQDNPFGSSENAHANPFETVENESDNPFGESETDRQRANGRQESRHAALLERLSSDKTALEQHLSECSDLINQLRAQLRNQQDEFQVVKNENLHLKTRLDAQTHQLTLESALHQELLLKLMRSGDKKMRLLALSNIQSRSLSDEGANAVVELSKTDDPNVKNLARQWLADSRPDISRTMGFQNSGRWQATNESDEYVKIAKAMDESCIFDFEDVHLSEIVDEIQDRYRFNVDLANGVDHEKLITFKVNGVPLRSGLTKMLSKHGLDFQINDDVFEITLKGQNEQSLSRIYHVKRVVEQGLAIEKVVGLINDMIDGENVRLAVIDEVRFGVKASESNQWLISKFLGELANK